MCIKQRKLAKNVLKKWKSIIDFFVSPNVVLYDGNGRIGRFIMLKQCIENNIDLILIDDYYSKNYKESLYVAQTKKIILNF